MRVEVTVTTLGTALLVVVVVLVVLSTLGTLLLLVHKSFCLTAIHTESNRLSLSLRRLSHGTNRELRDSIRSIRL